MNTNKYPIFDSSKFTNEYYHKIDNKLPKNITSEVIDLAFREGRYHEYSRMVFKHYVLMDM